MTTTPTYFSDNRWNLPEFSAHCRKANHLWWTDLKTNQPIAHDRGERAMLIVTELAEAAEGIRKNLMDDHLPHRRMEEVEMADALIRIGDYCGGFGIVIQAWHHTLSIHDLGGGRNKLRQLLFITKLVAATQTEREAYHMEYAANAIIYYCWIHELDLLGAVKEKLAYNAQRQDHTREARLAEGGKKF